MELNELDAIDLQLLDSLQRDASLSNVALAEKVNVSPPTCLRRVKRLSDEGWIERQVALLNANKLGATLGHSLTALVEVTLDALGAEHLDTFEQRACSEDAVQQCWRVSSGPDFVLVLQAVSMPQYLEATRRLLTQDANVRNVKAFFSLKRAKFTTVVPLPELPTMATVLPAGMVIVTPLRMRRPPSCAASAAPLLLPAPPSPAAAAEAAPAAYRG
jgi:DNA-binding Lrp family transcriptional regulator